MFFLLFFCLIFFGAVPPNFRHGGGPGAARAYDNVEFGVDGVVEFGIDIGVEFGIGFGVYFCA